MTVDEKGNKIYLTAESTRKRVLSHYHANRDAILKRRRELKQVNGEQQANNRQRWVLRNKERLHKHQQTYAAKKKLAKNALTR